MRPTESGEKMLPFAKNKETITSKTQGREQKAAGDEERHHQELHHLSLLPLTSSPSPNELEGGGNGAAIAVRSGQHSIGSRESPSKFLSRCDPPTSTRNERVSLPRSLSLVKAKGRQSVP
jgi:hypothetical protein